MVVAIPRSQMYWKTTTSISNRNHLRVSIQQYFDYLKRLTISHTITCQKVANSNKKSDKLEKWSNNKANKKYAKNTSSFKIQMGKEKIKI